MNETLIVLANAVKDLPPAQIVNVCACHLRQAGVVDDAFITLDGVADYAPVAITAGKLATALTAATGGPDVD